MTPHSGWVWGKLEILKIKPWLFLPSINFRGSGDWIVNEFLCASSVADSACKIAIAGSPVCRALIVIYSQERISHAALCCMLCSEWWICVCVCLCVWIATGTAQHFQFIFQESNYKRLKDQSKSINCGIYRIPSFSMHYFRQLSFTYHSILLLYCNAVVFFSLRFDTSNTHASTMYVWM